MFSPDLLNTNPNTQVFRFCPSCGKDGLCPASPKSFACPACGFSFFLNCAAAAMALILDDQDRLLVTRRRFDPGKGGLDLPGGFTEPGEGIQEALIREIREELNLEAKGLTYFCSVFNAYPYQQVIYPVTDMAFVCHIPKWQDLKPGDDVSEVLFIPVGQIDPERFAMASARQTVSRFKEKFTVRTESP